jgi:divalent metal cation (Fe/Co/Zn/Cd) transporter
MRDRQLGTTAPDHLRAGLRVSLLSIGWTLSASVVALVLGFGAASLVLVAFGFTGLLDAAGSAALVTHFRHALRHETFSERRERLALRVVTVGMLTVGVVTAVESVRRLLGGGSSQAVPAGLVLAAVSIGVLAALSHAKRRVASRIPSRALLADGWLSATGCLMAMATVVGTGATSAFGWWWVDPVAALVVAGGAVGVAVFMARDEGDRAGRAA